MKTFSLIVLLFFISVGFASAQDQACSSINDMKLSKGAKALLLGRCKANAARAAVAGSKFSALTTGNFFAIGDNTADLGNCGHPNHDFYFEAGFQKYSDTNGGNFDGPYVYVNFVDYDCNGNFLQEVFCFSSVPDGSVQLTPFKNGSVQADMDLDCLGATMHLTTDLAATAEGFTNSLKDKHIVKREVFNETNDYIQKDRFTISVGEVIFDGYSYDLNQGSNLGKFKSKFSHEDF